MSPFLGLFRMPVLYEGGYKALFSIKNDKIPTIYPKSLETSLIFFDIRQVILFRVVKHLII